MATDKTHVAINQYQQNAIEASNSAACGAFTIPFQIHTGVLVVVRMFTNCNHGNPTLTNTYTPVQKNNKK